MSKHLPSLGSILTALLLSLVPLGTASACTATFVVSIAAWVMTDITAYDLPFLSIFMPALTIIACIMFLVFLLTPCNVSCLRKANSIDSFVYFFAACIYDTNVNMIC